VNSFEVREPLGVVATKVLVETLLGVDPEELPDDFHGKHLTESASSGREPR
jgi:hypothetical protein